MSDAEIRPIGDELVLAVLGAVALLAVIPVLVVGGDYSFWMGPVTVAAAVAVYARRDSFHGLAALGAVAFTWVVAEPETVSAWSLVVAVLLFIAHASLALRTTAPPGASLGRATAVTWLRRGIVVVALTGLVYLLAFSVHNLRQTDAEVVLAATLAVLSVLVLLLRSETLDAAGRTVSRGERTEGS